MADATAAALAVLPWAAVWILVGAALGRRVLPDDAPRLAFAPLLGWAVVTVPALLILGVGGFSSATVIAMIVPTVGVAVVSLRRQVHADGKAGADVPASFLLAAAVLAAIPAAAVLPKVGPEGVSLALPIFDHAKVAIVDALVRLGLPPVNPVFAESGGPQGLSYYYLWHFSAAMIALPSGSGGWAAAAGLSWFTGFATLTLMGGLAVWWSRHPLAAWIILPLCVAASAWPPLAGLFGAKTMEAVLTPAYGLGGWLFQSSWAPQHVMAAGSAVLAIALLPRLADAPAAPLIATVAVVVSAAFQSSLWIGGVVLPPAAALVGVLLLVRGGPRQRLPFVLGASIAAVLALLLCLPLLREQIAASHLRAVAQPIRIEPQTVLGSAFDGTTARLLDLPAFWLVRLTVEFPAVWPLGALGLWALRRAPAAGAAAILAVGGLATSWLLVSTVGENNDLGWRAILPALLVLTAAAAALLASARGPRAAGLRAVALGTVVLGLPHGSAIAIHNLYGVPRPEADAAFADTPALWAAVRRYAAPDERVANNPLFLAEMTGWPVNISWALLADRSSCFAGSELALAFAPVPTARREAINDRFVRVFAGDASDDDLAVMVERFGCRVAVVTPRDGAWERDPFAGSRRFGLADEAPGRWRIYRAAAP